jgi:hypothetical protein
MTENVCELLAANPDWVQVLSAYAVAERNAGPRQEGEDGEEEAAGWVPRLDAVANVPEGRLAPIHGKLIALGLLRFQLLGRTAGVVYRLTTEARQSLECVERGTTVGENLGHDAAFATTAQIDVAA